MIHAKRTITVGEQESIIDRPIVLYRGDREVEIEFTLVGNEFMFSTEGNVIKSTNASHGQLVLNTPSGENMFSELAECHEGKIVFVVTKEMIDELIEIGFYSFQVRLYDGEEMRSRVTIPPVTNGFDIRNPIAAEDETNVVDVGLVEYSRITKEQTDDELPTFDWKGNYNKTEWEHHDLIAVNKMNKIEDALYTINEGLNGSDNSFLEKINNIEKGFQNKINGLEKELGDEIDEVNRTINNRINKLEVDVNVGDVALKNEIEDIASELENNINDTMVNINVTLNNEISKLDTTMNAKDNAVKNEVIEYTDEQISILDTEITAEINTLENNIDTQLTTLENNITTQINTLENNLNNMPRILACGLVRWLQTSGTVDIHSDFMNSGVSSVSYDATEKSITVYMTAHNITNKPLIIASATPDYPHNVCAGNYVSGDTPYFKICFTDGNGNKMDISTASGAYVFFTVIG